MTLYETELHFMQECACGCFCMRAKQAFPPEGQNTETVNPVSWWQYTQIIFWKVGAEIFFVLYPAILQIKDGSEYHVFNDPTAEDFLDYRSITVLRNPSSPQSARWLRYPRGDSGWGALTSPGCWINKAPCLLTGRQATFYNYDGELIIFPCYVCLFCYFPFLSSLVSSVVLLPVLVIPPFFVPVLWSSPVSQCRSSWLFSCVLLFILPPPLNLTFSYKHIPFTLVIGVLYPLFYHVLLW